MCTRLGWGQSGELPTEVKKVLGCQECSVGLGTVQGRNWDPRGSGEAPGKRERSLPSEVQSQEGSQAPMSDLQDFGPGGLLSEGQGGEGWAGHRGRTAPFLTCHGQAGFMSLCLLRRPLHLKFLVFDKGLCIFN